MNGACATRRVGYASACESARVGCTAVGLRSCVEASARLELVSLRGLRGLGLQSNSGSRAEALDTSRLVGYVRCLSASSGVRALIGVGGVARRCSL